MRKKFEEQMKFTYMIPENKLGKELESISQILDDNSRAKPPATPGRVAKAML